MKTFFLVLFFVTNGDVTDVQFTRTYDTMAQCSYALQQLDHVGKIVEGRGYYAYCLPPQVLQKVM